ncbi:MAG: serine/threonine-protein kinase [Planctomycetota bacterium]|nr:serine/threonine-protein kinase [Planctomycetota bacterium]
MDADRPDDATLLRTLPTDRYGEFKPAGVGGMGIVYWAIDTDLNREVAFKIIRPVAEEGTATPGRPTDLATPEQGTEASDSFEALKQRFLQEAWITSGLAHPGIVPVYELGQTAEGVPYYTMRFIRGETTLATAIAAVAGKGIEERLALLEPFLKVCDALRHAHSRGVIHRDLKPENVALGEFGETVVLDWGLAKVQGREDPSADRLARHIEAYRDATDLQTVAGAMGTPGYMPPEAVRDDAEAMDERSDVYSLGAMLYEILTGQLPHGFTTFFELARKLIAEDPPAAREVDDHVPVALSDLCAACLARDMDARPASVDQLADAIRRWQVEREQARELEGFVREARTALEAAEDLHGEALLQQLDRATAAVGQVLQRRPGSTRGASLKARAAALRETGIRERERGARKRVLVRGAVLVLALAAVAGCLVSGALRSERDRADVERTRALGALETADTIMAFLNDDVLGSVDPRESRGRDVTLREVLDKAAADVGARFTDRPDVEAPLRRTLGRVYLGIGRYAEAREHLERARVLFAQLEGEESLALAVTLEFLARRESVGVGDAQRALALARRVVAIRTRVLGPKDALTLRASAAVGMYEALAEGKLTTSLDNPMMLTMLATVRARGETSEQMRRELIALIYEAERLWRAQDMAALGAFAERVAKPFLENKAFAERVPWAWAAMAASLQADGRPDAARALAWSAIAVGEPRWGEAHPQVVFAIQTMAKLVHEQGDFEGAQRWTRRTLRLQRQILGAEHAQVVDTQENLAVVLLQLGSFEEAATEAAAAYALRVKLDGAEADSARWTADLLARIHTAWKKPAEAATWRARAGG